MPRVPRFLEKSQANTGKQYPGAGRQTGNQRERRRAEN